MSFACVGLFRSILSREDRAVRYLSDASYWIYLAHLPLVIITQTVICNWVMPALVKFLLASLFVGAAMLLTYDKLVRYTFIGRFLNGNRLWSNTPKGEARSRHVN